jgi:hypothetical protein
MSCLRFAFRPLVREGLFGTLLSLLMAAPVFSQVDQILPPIGGSGGGQFVARCALGDVLTGVELRAGDDVDSIRPFCAAAYGPQAIGPRQLYSTNFGGDGGRVLQLLCPANAPLVAKLIVEYEGARTRTVNSVHLYCSKIALNLTLPKYPTVVFDGPAVGHTNGTAFTGQDPVFLYSVEQACPAGLVPVGLNGRAGIWLDALGLVCGALRMDASRAPVQLGKVAPLGATAPARPICEVARDARERNSPAAPGLEAQCAASQPAPKQLGRVDTSRSSTAPRTICQTAQDARARNSPAAASLEAQCRTASIQELGALAEQGAALASADPLLTALRSRIADGPARRGFDIGVAATGADTLPGPGKQRTHDLLGTLEQGGFDAALSFLLQRNRNVALSARGAEIARQDPVVDRARVAEGDVFYWLGFDIATGIFGDPALGARGNTATGPGSLAIRDALSPVAQRGFNASVALHLSRNYHSAPPAVINGPALPAPVVLNGPAVPVPPGPADLVISQVYSGGGSVGGLFARDYVVLLNRSARPTDLSGWSIQYAAAKGFAWQVSPLSGVILPGHYLLIAGPARPGAGDELPMLDLTGNLSLATAAGKLALVRRTAALDGFCPAGPELADFVGYGDTNCSEGAAPAVGLDRNTAAFRRGSGCEDTNHNGIDFEVAAPAPRTQATPPVACAVN